MAALATGIAATQPPADIRARVLRFLESSEPPPAAGAEHWQWTEAVAAARSGPGAGISAPDLLVAAVRGETQPVHLASALVYADEAVVRRLAPAELDGFEAALDRWRAVERDPDRSELYLFALHRIDTLRKLMSP